MIEQIAPRGIPVVYGLLLTGLIWAVGRVVGWAREMWHG